MLFCSILCGIRIFKATYATCIVISIREQWSWKTRAYHNDNRNKNNSVLTDCSSCSDILSQLSFPTELQNENGYLHFSDRETGLERWSPRLSSSRLGSHRFIGTIFSCKGFEKKTHGEGVTEVGQRQGEYSWIMCFRCSPCKQDPGSNSPKWPSKACGMCCVSYAQVPVPEDASGGSPKMLIKRSHSLPVDEWEKLRHRKVRWLA